MFFIPGINNGTIMSEASIKLEVERGVVNKVPCSTVFPGAKAQARLWSAKLERPCVRSVKTRLRSQWVPIEHAGLLANSHVNPRLALSRPRDSRSQRALPYIVGSASSLTAPRF